MDRSYAVGDQSPRDQRNVGASRATEASIGRSSGIRPAWLSRYVRRDRASISISFTRYLMAMAAKHDLEIEQMDSVTAFLQGTLGEEKIYKKQPKEFTVDPTKVCRLKKAMYRLNQSCRVWNLWLDAVESGCVPFL